MGVFDRQIASAKRLIEKYGQSVQWKPYVAADADDATPWKPKLDTSDPADPVMVRIVFLPASRVNNELVRALSNAPEVPSGKSYGLMPAVNFVPSLADVVIRDGVEYRPCYIDPLSPNGEIIMYTIGFEL